MCIICRQYKDKSELLRYTKNFQTGEISENNDNSVTGRSVYICKEGNCFNLATKKGRIESVLKNKK